jgi:hypothetical protein
MPAQRFAENRAELLEAAHPNVSEIWTQISDSGAVNLLPLHFLSGP